MLPERATIFKFLGVLILLASIPVAVYLVGRVAKFFGKASGTPADLVINAGTFLPERPDSWKNLAQGGEETGRMLAPVLPQIKELGPQYIRIDHIYDLYGVVQRSGAGLTYDWTKLDATIDDILATGATPFISLSYFPPAIAQDGITGTPQDWGLWEEVVQKTIEHVSGTRGIGGVYYEVWNEPDLFGGFKAGRDKNYFELYLHSALGAQKAKGVKAFKFGGPATTALYKSWFDGLLKFAEANNLRLDFYSWHRYSKDLGVFEDDSWNAASWLADYPRFSEIEFIVSEIGPNSENDPVYDNNFAAIHTLATAAMYEGRNTKIFHFEIKDGPGKEKYWGRWGMMTHEKYGVTVKPRFNAILFLNRMRGKLIDTAGLGSWVKAFSKVDGNIIRTLVVNYDASGKHTEAVPLTFLNLPSQNFTVRRVNFGGGVEEVSVATSSANWSTLELFQPNSAAILELIPQNPPQQTGI